MLQDVCGKNCVGIRHALLKMGYKDLADLAIEAALGTGAWTDAELAKKWMSLETYRVFEGVILEGVGHPQIFGQIGRYASERAFGSQAIDRHLVQGGVKWVSTPRLAVKVIPEATKAFVINKTWRFVYDTPNRALLHVDYVDVDGIFRLETEDIISLRYYIPGLIGSIPDIWGTRAASHYKARFRTMNLRPQEIIEKVWPKGQQIPEVAIREGRFCVGSSEYGKIVHLRRDVITDQFLGDGYYSHEQEAGTIPAILITRNFETKRTGTDEVFPILEIGDVYRFELPLPNLMEITWATSLWRRFFEFFLLMVKGTNKDLSQESRTADAEHKVEKVSEQLAQTEAFLARTMPTKEIAALAARRILSPFDADIAVLQFDVVSYTARTEGWAAAHKAQEIGGLLQSLLSVGVKRGGWDYKTIGDAGVLIFNPSWVRGRGDHNPITSLQKASRVALLAAEEMHRVAHQKGYSLRIGINVGASTWYDISTFATELGSSVISPRLEANGDAFDLAARLEAITSPGSTAVTHNAMVTAFGTHFTSSDLQSNVVLGFRDAGMMTVKGDRQIHTWVRNWSPTKSSTPASLAMVQ